MRLKTTYFVLHSKFMPPILWGIVEVLLAKTKFHLPKCIVIVPSFFAQQDYDSHLWKNGDLRFGAAKEYAMFLMLWLFFILLSGKWTFEIVLFGLGIALLVLAFACAFMGWSLKKEAQFMRRLPRVILCGVSLFFEIVKANFVTLRRIFLRKGEEPAIVTIRTPLKHEWQRVLLANAITLTPGTNTLHLEGDALTVHCLNQKDADGLENSSMEKKIARLEGKK